MGFYWDPEKKVDVNLAQAANYVVDVFEDLQEKVKGLDVHMQELRQELQRIRGSIDSASGSSASVATSIESAVDSLQTMHERTTKTAAITALQNENLELQRANSEMLRRMNEAERQLKAIREPCVFCRSLKGESHAEDCPAAPKRPGDAPASDFGTSADSSGTSQGAD